MEDMKSALINLEQAVLRLEGLIHQTKKTSEQVNDEVAKLKQVIRTTYKRLDKALATFRQEGE